ncbi:MAG: hypothetical protein ACF8R7_14285 [Phycisphaerales bacterium JB039]
MPHSAPTSAGASRLKLLGLCAACALAVVTAALYARAFGWENLFVEGSWAEIAQQIVWVAGACWAWWRIPRVAGRDRWMVFWLAVMASLAAAREQDLQKYLNPKRFGDYGVHFKINWWLDGSVPLWLKAGWALVGLILVAAVTVPLLRARPRLVLLTLGLDRAVWLFGAGGALLVVGYGADDLFGRGQVMSLTASEVLEETCELIGALLIVWSIALTARVGLDEREARAKDVLARLRGRRAG